MLCVAVLGSCGPPEVGVVRQQRLIAAARQLAALHLGQHLHAR